MRIETYTKSCLSCGADHTLTESNDDNAEYNQERTEAECKRCGKQLHATRCARLEAELA